MSIVTPATENVAAAEANTGTATSPTIVHFDPHDLVIEDNIRTNVDLDTEFVRSVREHGVLLPVRAYLDGDDRVIVRDGQLRVLAAREVGTTVPAYVVNASDDTVARILEQLATNDRRRGLSTAERTEAWQQLALEGLSPTAIARKTGAKRDVVKAGLSVLAHDEARKALADYDLTIEQAAVVMEFDGAPDAVAELREIAKTDPKSFDHTAQRLRDDKARRDEFARVRAEYEADGVTVVGWPAWDETNVAFLYQLQTNDGERLTEENYTGKPGYAMAITEGGDGVIVRPVVVDWKQHGLQRNDGRGNAASRPMSEEEKVARRVVVANNKAWGSAERVRRNWIRSFLGRKRLPADALGFAVTILAEESFAVE